VQRSWLRGSAEREPLGVFYFADMAAMARRAALSRMVMH
jgi:hypothetical protein